MAINEIVARLNEDQIVKLQEHILNAGLRVEQGINDHKSYFRRLSKQSKGKLRICYATLRNASREEFDKVCDALVSYDAR